MGIISDTIFINTVRESKIVTPKNENVMGGGAGEEMLKNIRSSMV